MSHTQESAEVVALQVLAWLAGDEELLPVFQGSSGASTEDLRAGAQDAVFLGSVLDFIMMDDAWVVRCCDDLKLEYTSLMRARQQLPGGAQVNWT
ncbi:DUF3572 domain-containing protein [Roseobacter denitrificans]|uniref:DUF3572 domain-containing protein n=1 Tax=Roseobacter denitrificans (strain ATCC 33942 / OCh 114) TaxID=375451 RepID=Q166K7_ROSDO|nr:DUF3572 domain-containing protein [Roseobacter denitrificans]ABG32086.1 conserved hypothetical protein [Roseobacter denitrificans OCh 114]AVL51604.1 DUF3572 domain-containing protein [Roseobacter denitrificans]SFF77147.1 Protein of unknown function [Roseobacter denitrificans OCh 114]